MDKSSFMQNSNNLMQQYTDQQQHQYIMMQSNNSHEQHGEAQIIQTLNYQQQLQREMYLQAQMMQQNAPPQVVPQSNRSCSAPPKFDSQSLFLYQEDDQFTRNFNKGFMPMRLDEDYNQFYLLQMKNQKQRHLQANASNNGAVNIQNQKTQIEYDTKAMPQPITVNDEEELLSQLKAPPINIVPKQTISLRLRTQVSSGAQSAENQQEQPQLQLQKSQGSGHSNSPNANNASGPAQNTLGRTLAKALGRMETPAEILQRRRQRLSTISSDFVDESAESPRIGKQRRKSSNFDMLCDPFKYQDYVQKFLDGIEEENCQTTQNNKSLRKRTRSNNFFTSNNQTTLYEIHEEDHQNDLQTRKQRISSTDDREEMKKAAECDQDEAPVYRATSNNAFNIKESIQSYQLAKPIKQHQPNTSALEVINQTEENNEGGAAQEQVPLSPIKHQEEEIKHQQRSSMILQGGAKVSDHLTVAQLAKKFRLISTFETLEGHERLNPKEMKALLEYSHLLAKDQGGCRFLQMKIEENDPETNSLIFDHTIDTFIEIMNDPFGNYLAQKIAESCNDDQLTKIIQNMKQDPVNLCRHAHGTRSIQKIIEIIKKPQHIQLLSSFLKDRVRELAEDINGNHVIQKILLTWKPQFNQFIYDAMIHQCVQIACHKHGCCVMQKCIDGAEIAQKMSLMLEIAKHTLVFVKNPYGNYVVQYVLELKNIEVNKKIGEQLLKNLLQLGREKFSSNVIEKCLEHNSPEVKEAMVNEILSADSFYDFLLDQYGNYVIQKSLSVAQEPGFSNFIEKLKPDMERLKHSNEFGVKIYNRLVKQYPQLATNDKSTKAGSSQYSAKKGKEKPQTVAVSGPRRETGIQGPKNLKSQPGQVMQKKQNYKSQGSSFKEEEMPIEHMQSNQQYYNPYMGSYQGGYPQSSKPQSNVNINININANFAPTQDASFGVFKPQQQSYEIQNSSNYQGYQGYTYSPHPMYYTGNNSGMPTSNYHQQTSLFQNPPQYQGMQLQASNNGPSRGGFHKRGGRGGHYQQ